MKSKKKQTWPWGKVLGVGRYQSQNIWPKISVVTPSFNQGQFIEKTIRSVLMQCYPNLEYIIMDGGSTDGTVDILRRYDMEIDYWTSENDRGQAHAINKGLSRASGEILYWINSDDYLLPNALWRIGSFPWSPEVGAVVGIGHKVDTLDRIQYTPKVPELSYQAFLRWVGYGNFMQPACFFSAEAWKKCGPLDERLQFCLDVDLWLKIAQRYRFERLSYELAHAYIHPEAKTTANVEKMKMETALLIASHGELEAARDILYQVAEEHQQYYTRHRRLAEHPLVRLIKRVMN